MSDTPSNGIPVWLCSPESFSYENFLRVISGDYCAGTYFKAEECSKE